jgi:hypothetical protein
MSSSPPAQKQQLYASADLLSAPSSVSAVLTGTVLGRVPAGPPRPSALAVFSSTTSAAVPTIGLEQELLGPIDLPRAPRVSAFARHLHEARLSFRVRKPDSDVGTGRTRRRTARRLTGLAIVADGSCEIRISPDFQS